MASVTHTYARALADVVFDRKLDPQRTLREVQSVSESVTGSKELKEVWETPSITAEQKRAVLDAIVSREGISPEVRNFVAVLIDHRRISFLGDIAKQFEQELSQRMGFVEAEITSARDLDGPGEKHPRIPSLEVNRQECARPVLSRRIPARRRRCANRKHNLRRVGGRAVDENSGENSSLSS